MFSLRRAVFRAASSPTFAVLSKPRSFGSIASPLCRTQIRLSVSPLQRRFVSEETAAPSEATATDETVPPETSAAGESAAPEASTSAAESAPTETPASQNPNAEPKFPPHYSEASAEELSRILYIGNLFFEISEKDLIQHFTSKIGPVVRAKIATDPRGLSKGFGWLELENRDDAVRAVQELDQSVFEGRRMVCQFQRARPSSALRSTLNEAKVPNPPSKTLFIGNMSFEMSDKDLNDLFRPIRNVLDVRVAIDRRTGQPRGFAHADFIDEPSATKAMEILKEKEIYGRRLRVDYTGNTSRPNNNAA